MITGLIQRWNQRFDDWHHERAIKRWRKRCEDRVLAGDKIGERIAFAKMITLCNARSPQQIERMERAAGIFRGSN